MSRFFLLVLFLSLFIGSPSFSCMQESRIRLNGDYTYSMSRDFQYDKSGYDSSYAAQLFHELDSTWQKHHRVEDYLDCGVMLAYMGKYKEALTIFQWVPLASLSLHSLLMFSFSVKKT